MTEPAPDAREIARKWRIVRDSNSYAYVDRQTVGWNIVASPMNEHNALADAYIALLARLEDYKDAAATAEANFEAMQRAYDALLARVERLERERTEARLEAESFRYIVIEWRGMYDAAITEAAAQRARADAAKKALEKYGRHTLDCQADQWSDAQRVMGDCTCGLSDALAAAKGERG